MPRLTTRLTCALLLTAAVPAQQALAQTARGSLASAAGQTGDLFARDRVVAVRDRPRPDYEALGVPFGTFMAYPRVQLDAEYNDNIFAVATGADDDWIVRIKPEVSLESGWSRHSLGAYARGTISRYQDFDGENSEDYGVGAAGRLDITRAANLAAGADYASLTEPRTSSNAPASTVEPISYSLASGYLAGSRVSGRVKLSGRGDIRTYDYEDGVTLTGVEIDQDNRDRTVTSLSGRGDYAISPATALFVQATANSRDYDTATSLLLPARDSDGYEILAGANFEIGALSRGEIAVGYINQEFDEAVYSKIDGFGARAQVEWFPTQLTTVTATGSRTIEDSGIAGSGGYLSSAVGLAVDHELMRNVLLNAGVTFSRDQYEGLDREDERLQASVGGTYLMNRTLGISLAASRFEQTSDGVAGGVDFEVNRLTLSLVAQF
ncbi:outer membrane beta-barrel protein [Brevundimonas sp. R86498]|uniref:outer membrane beta-barrel protein n=1 Tax=Brevundimonas sp. R86498 TaxID=3093845 RepID=UPI0037C87503